MGAGILALVVCLAPAAAHAVDEIQVYNAEIADVGQWTLQQHLNYAINGRKDPDFPGGLIPHHALNGTPELAWGVTNWWELGWYAPFAIDQNGDFHSNGAKIRTLFVTPNAAKREVFYGVNIELGYATPLFSQTRVNMEIRPIIGVRKGDWELIVNPIVDIGFGNNGDTEFAPAARLARKLKDDLSVGVEYYSALGPIGNFLPLAEALDGSVDVAPALARFAARRLPVNARIIERARHLGAYLQATQTAEERARSEQHGIPAAVMAETAVLDFLYA